MDLFIFQECLNVWTMEGVARDKHGGHVLNFQPDNKRNIPKQLELICTLSFNRDFTFISGLYMLFYFISMYQCM